MHLHMFIHSSWFVSTLDRFNEFAHFTTLYSLYLYQRENDTELQTPTIKIQKYKDVKTILKPYNYANILKT